MNEQELDGRCATIGHKNRTATRRITYGDDGDRVTEYVCAECAESYGRRPSLRNLTAEVTFRGKVEALAALVLEQSRERIAREYGQWQADAETVQVHPRKLYTLIDRGPEHNMSGMLMIEHATGSIYGIKAYGKVHRGHAYGTLDTAGDWYWGSYYPERRPAEA